MEMIVTHLNTINTISCSTLLFFLSFLELTWHNNYATLRDNESPLCFSSQTLDESSVSMLTRGKPRDGRRVSNKLQTRSFGVSERIPSPGVSRVDRAHQTTRPVRNQVRPNAVFQPGPETLSTVICTHHLHLSFVGSTLLAPHQGGFRDPTWRSGVT